MPQRVARHGMASADANFGVTLVLVTVLFALLYRISARCLGGLAGCVDGSGRYGAFILDRKNAHRIVSGSFHHQLAFGAAGSVVVFLLWVYYSAQIFLFGAEFTEVYAVARRARAAALPRRHLVK